MASRRRTGDKKNSRFCRPRFEREIGVPRVHIKAKSRDKIRESRLRDSPVYYFNRTSIIHPAGHRRVRGNARGSRRKLSAPCQFERSRREFISSRAAALYRRARA